MININVDSNMTSIPLGKRLENEARIISFDLSGFIAEYGEGTAVLLAKRSQDSTAYPVGAEREGDKLLWTVLNSDTEYKGQGKCELFWYVGETLAKSVVYSTYVENDIGEEGEVPEPIEPWIQQILEAVGRVEALGEELLALYKHTVYVDDNGDFYVNTDEGE